MKKKILWLVMGLTLLMTACAAPPPEPEDPSYEQQLSDAMLLCRENLPLGQAALRELDAQLLGGRQIAGEGCTLGLWQLRCGEQTVLLWQLICGEAEAQPGTLDTLHLTWEGADYYLAYGDGMCSSLQGREGNSVAFNVMDAHLSAGDNTWGAVYLQDRAEAYTVQLKHTANARESVLADVGEKVTVTSRDVQQIWTLSLEHKEETA